MKKSLNKTRKGEIALAVLKYFLKERGIRLSPELRGEINRIAKWTEIPREELKKFTKDFILEYLREILD